MKRNLCIISPVALVAFGLATLKEKRCQEPNRLEDAMVPDTFYFPEEEALGMPQCTEPAIRLSEQGKVLWVLLTIFGRSVPLKMEPFQLRRA